MPGWCSLPSPAQLPPLAPAIPSRLGLKPIRQIEPRILWAPHAGGINEQQYVQLRSEAKAPFRLTRIIFVGGLAVGAALGLFIITGRLLAALQGRQVERVSAI